MALGLIGRLGQPLREADTPGKILINLTQYMKKRKIEISATVADAALSECAVGDTQLGSSFGTKPSARLFLFFGTVFT